MGKLDDKSYARTIASCTKCGSEVGAAAFEVASYIDRQTSVMLGARAATDRWIHDTAKLVDGVFKVTCIRCRDDAFTTVDCPRCHREGALVDVLGQATRLAVPTRCPSCKGAELTVTGFAPATVRTGEGLTPSPAPLALVGDVGFHVAQIECDGCEWVAVAEGCPLCGGAGPLRARPSDQK